MRISTLFFSLSALVLPLAAQAQAPGQEYGQVLSATPVVQQVAIPQQVCSPETLYGSTPPSGAGAVMGAIAGGAMGNAIGGGGGRAATTALGVIGGALLGNQIEGNGPPQAQTVQRCTTETRYENRTLGYDVVYEYAGRQYTTRTATDPGPQIALSVQPAYPSAPSGGYPAYDQVPVQPGVVVSPYAQPYVPYAPTSYVAPYAPLPAAYPYAVVPPVTFIGYTGWGYRAYGPSVGVRIGIGRRH